MSSLYSLIQDTCLNEYKTARNRVHWYHEFLLYLLVKYIYPDTLFQYSPEFLNGMIYDIYVPSIHLAIEYQGQHHFFDIKHHSLTAEEVKERDKNKKEMSIKNNVTLIQWPFDQNIELSYLIKVIKETKNIKVDIPTKSLVFKKLSDLCLTNPNEKRKIRYCFCQYDRNGKFIKSFDSCEEAANEVGVTAKTIMKAYNAFEGYKLAGNSLWVKCSSDSIRKQIKPYYFDNVDYEKLKIQCFDENGVLVRVFDSHNEASRFAGVDKGTIKDCLIGIQKKAGGYLWKYRYDGEKTN